MIFSFQTKSVFATFQDLGDKCDFTFLASTKSEFISCSIDNLVIQKDNSTDKWIFYDPETVEKIEVISKDIPCAIFNQNCIVYDAFETLIIKFKEEQFNIKPCCGAFCMLRYLNRKDGLYYILLTNKDEKNKLITLHKFFLY